MQQDIPGTTIFDGSQAQKGLALNRMCFSFNSAENRAAFLKDEDAYCRKYGLSDEQRAAVKSRSALNMIAEGKQGDPYWKPFFRGFDYVHDWLARTKPDVAVVFYNDHGLNFFLDKLPTFAVGASAEYRSEDEGWGIPVSRPVPGDADLSWHLINTLVADEFDVTMCQDMLIDHAVTIPMALMWPSAASSDRPWPVKIVPVEINTVQHPLPSMARCLKLGRSIGRGLETYPRDLRVAVVGTGGLSHQLDGARAGFVNKEFDALCLDKIVAEPEALARYSIHELVELSGSQGVEFLNWMAMRGALTGRVSELNRNYHIPVSNTAAATVVYDNQAAFERKAA